ncbi:hypothetical protein MPSEU_001076700 [Mayamaea pseudoterrestris]|nr:hypothetical protein MPSEU_001076700 [Mayamaea pseudoterrestris]
MKLLDYLSSSSATAPGSAPTNATPAAAESLEAVAPEDLPQQQQQHDASDSDNNNPNEDEPSERFTSSQNLQGAPSDDSNVQHSGRALVRGKIRNVWRPRYLQVLHNGLVDYYEVTLDRRHSIYKYTLEICDARVLNNNSNWHKDLSMELQLPRGMVGFCLQGRRVAASTDNAASATYEGDHEQQQAMSLLLNDWNVPADASSPHEWRDIYCAVDRMEEAQAWVTALQWAARVRTTSTTSVEHVATATSTVTAKDATNTKTEDWTKVVTRDKNMKTDRKKIKSAPSAASKIVVAKIVQYQIVCVGSLLQYEIAYEIHCLLLKQDKAETWFMLKTAHDLEVLVSDLVQAQMLDVAQLECVRSLPRIASKPHFADVQASVATADAILRSLIMDATMVNSKFVKAFLGLAPLTSVPTKHAPAVGLARCWSMMPTMFQRHDSTLYSNRTTHTVSIPTDQYVRQWFASHVAKKQPSMPTIYMTRLLQQPLVILGGVSVGVAAFQSLGLLWERMTAPTVSVRLDVLVLSWISAAYIGHCVPLQRWPVWNANDVPLAIDTRGEQKLMPRAIPIVEHGTTIEQVLIKPTGGGASATTLDDGVLVEGDADEFLSSTDSEQSEDGEELLEGASVDTRNEGRLSSPLPKYPENEGMSCWSPAEDSLFNVRGESYFVDRIKRPSDPSPLTCRGVDIFLTDSPQRHISRHPAMLGGKLNEQDTFLVNFLLPFGNFVAYFAIPPLDEFPSKLQTVWSNFLKGDQEYRDARLKLLPVVVEGPWIVKTAVGPGNAPALLGKVIPLQYFFRDATTSTKAAYEVDVIITASALAKGVLSVVKGSASSVSIAFAFIIEAAAQDELPETVLCSFQIHSICLDDCPILAPFDDSEEEDVHSM